MHPIPSAARGAALALLLLAPAAARAQEVRAGDLVVARPWTRATPAGATVAAGYVTLTNTGAEADTLTGGSFEGATGFAVHETANQGGVMTMRPTGPLAIPPGGTVTLAPGGRHAMFTGLTRPLRAGETVAGTLVFARAGTVPVSYAVQGLGARPPAAGAAHGAHGMDMH